MAPLLLWADIMKPRLFVDMDGTLAEFHPVQSISDQPMRMGRVWIRKCMCDKRNGNGNWG